MNGALQSDKAKKKGTKQKKIQLENNKNFTKVEAKECLFVNRFECDEILHSKVQIVVALESLCDL